MLTIRRASADDAERATQIYVESWNAGFASLMPHVIADEARIARWAGELATGSWWVAEYDGALAGLVGVCASRDPVDPQLGELDTIAVDPAYWRKGVGTALMRTALEALAADYPEAILWTLANYDRGQQFYEATGWTADGGTRDGGHQVSYRFTSPRT